ncbi:MAG TPA: ankyrin repeat domain-containing protein [Rhodocyclaceae bacterium]|nr:ankyrin repeat domain-containing protein [Rhodocyclaceae bacterium]
MQKKLESIVVRWLLAGLIALSASGIARADNIVDALSSARLGDTPQLVDLLKRGVSPDTVDEQGNSLLMLAAREGQVPTVKALLGYKPKVSHRNQAGDSALMLATLRGDGEMVELLLEAGAQFDHDGWTPLIYAAFEGHLALVERFLALGANVNALAPNGSNALMFAGRNGHLPVVARLLKTDIDLEQQNDRGFTAETWALSNKNTDIADLINKERARRGAQPPSLTIEIK